MRSTLVALSVLFSASCWAQTPASDTPPAMPVTPSAAPSGAVSATAPEPAEVPPVAAATTAPPVSDDCRPLTNKAMAADLKALTAQSQKAEVTELVQLHTAAAALWGKATEACEGRAKERAQRNLAESQKASALLQEQMGNAPECSAAHKDATLLQGMARTALGERRWTDAASLFHKAEDMWDLATEHCKGSQKEAAEKRLAQAEVDGYNAEFCAPLFDRARDYTQKLRARAAGIAREEKNEGLMVAETLWREAKEQCKGTAAQESARNNAQALARERGTPWVARAPAPETDPAPQPIAPSQAAAIAAAAAGRSATPAKAQAQAVAALEFEGTHTPAALPTPKGTVGSAAPVKATAGTPAIPAASPLATAAAATAAPAATSAASSTNLATDAAGGLLSNLLGSLLPSSAVPAAAAPPKPQAQPESFTVGDMHFKGQFVRDVDSPTLSGTGLLTWGNGDVFEGTLRQGKRHGKGRFVWANGQRYQGDWQDDVPTGQAVVDFANTNHYEGQVVNSVPEGKGRMVYPSGDIYEGQFRNGEPEGAGQYTWKNSQKYEGQWVGGKPNGQGKLLFANGDRYEGLFKDGSPHQQGSFTWVNGDRYTGAWNAGLKEGQGVFTWASGDRWEGLFRNDVQVLVEEAAPKKP